MEKNIYISQPVLQIHTHNPHTQLIHYSHPSAMVGSKNTLITHSGAYYEVLRKLLHNVSPMKTMQSISGLNMHQWVLRQRDVDRYRSGWFLPPSVVMVEFWALTPTPHTWCRKWSSRVVCMKANYRCFKHYIKDQYATVLHFIPLVCSLNYWVIFTFFLWVNPNNNMFSSTLLLLF